MPTFADEQHPERFAGRVTLMPGRPPAFLCRCGRTVPGDMMLEVFGAPETLRDQDAYRCDACWRRWLLEGRIDADELRRVTGRPPRGRGKPW